MEFRRVLIRSRSQQGIAHGGTAGADQPRRDRDRTVERYRGDRGLSPRLSDETYRLARRSCRCDQPHGRAAGRPCRDPRGAVPGGRAHSRTGNHMMTSLSTPAPATRVPAAATPTLAGGGDGGLRTAAEAFEAVVLDRTNGRGGKSVLER